MRSVVMLIAALAATFPALRTAPAFSQSPTAPDAASLAAELIGRVASESDCELGLLAAPQLDDFSEQWLVAYEAVGEQCDAAAERLHALGRRADLLFFRRPSSGQVGVLLHRIVRAVARTVACRMTPDASPRVNSQGTWVATVLASGPDCRAAFTELNRRGEPHGIQFRRRPEPGAVPDPF